MQTNSTCAGPSCSRAPIALALCSTHYQQQRHGRPLVAIRPRVKQSCGAPECDRVANASGHCQGHRKQIAKGWELRPFRPRRGRVAGDSAGPWFVGEAGYVKRSVKKDGKWRPEIQHRVIMEQHLGRKLLKGENVHHINGVRHDNRIENLELWNTSQPSGQRVADKLAWAREIIALYG